MTIVSTQKVTRGTDRPHRRNGRPRIAAGRARRRSRIALSRLSAAHIRDIGIEPGVAAEEAKLPFWRP